MPSDSPYDGLRQKLEQTNDWPKVYLFKFIVPNDNEKVALAQALFGAEAQITMTKSRTGKYVSISAKEMMLSTGEVIAKYDDSSKIEGLIAL